MWTRCCSCSTRDASSRKVLTSGVHSILFCFREFPGFVLHLYGEMKLCRRKLHMDHKHFSWNFFHAVSFSWLPWSSEVLVSLPFGLTVCCACYCFFCRRRRQRSAGACGASQSKVAMIFSESWYTSAYMESRLEEVPKVFRFVSRQQKAVSFWISPVIAGRWPCIVSRFFSSLCWLFPSLAAESNESIECNEYFR